MIASGDRRPAVRPGPRVVGDFNLRLSARENQFTNLPPEKSKSYEIGAKTSFLDGRGRFNVAAVRPPRRSSR